MYHEYYELQIVRRDLVDLIGNLTCRQLGAEFGSLPLETSDKAVQRSPIGLKQLGCFGLNED